MHIGSALVFLWLMWELVAVRQSSQMLLAFSSRLLMNEASAKDSICNLHDVFVFGKSVGWTIEGNLSTLKTKPKLVRWMSWQQLFLTKQKVQITIVSIEESVCRLSIKIEGVGNLQSDLKSLLQGSGRGLEVQG